MGTQLIKVIWKLAEGEKLIKYVFCSKSRYELHLPLRQDHILPQHILSKWAGLELKLFSRPCSLNDKANAKKLPKRPLEAFLAAYRPTSWFKFDLRMKFDPFFFSPAKKHGPPSNNVIYATWLTCRLVHTSSSDSTGCVLRVSVPELNN